MSAQSESVQSSVARPSGRIRALLAVLAFTALAAGAWYVYWNAWLRGRESTDNAYVQAPLVQITAQQAGTVISVQVDDTDVVKSGQTLVRLDSADALLALQRAEAELGRTVREVRTLYANNAVLAASVRARRSDVDRQQAAVSRANEDLVRRRPLVASGAIGAEELRHAETSLTSARAELSAAQGMLETAREQMASNQVLTDGTDLAHHPSVQRASAAVREAWLALQRIEIPAPVSGQVARRTVQVGQRIAAGSTLMAIVPLGQVWVDANFKEVQLRDMRIGQPVKLHADLYGSKVEFDGRIAGLGAGTGAAFAVLPPQNASGNWIKVVQRVPVRIELDAAQLARYPLRVGLSMEATVDVSRVEGAALTEVAARTPPVRMQTTEVFDASMQEADSRIRRILAQNMGRDPLPGDRSADGPSARRARP